MFALRIERFQEGQLYRAFSEINGDSARLRFIRYGRRSSDGISAGAFELVELGQTLRKQNPYNTNSYLAAIARCGAVQPIVGFPGWPFVASMGKDVLVERISIRGGTGIFDLTELYPDGSLDLRPPVNAGITMVDQMGSATAGFYRTLVEKGYLTSDDPVYDEIKHLL